MNVKSGRNWRSRPIILDGRPVYPLGFLIRDVLLQKGEANPYEIYKHTQALKARYVEMPQFRYRYGTIRTYFYWLRVLGFITFRRSEPSSKMGLKDKNFYELTSKGKQALDEEWRNIRKTYGNRS